MPTREALAAAVFCVTLVILGFVCARSLDGAAGWLTLGVLVLGAAWVGAGVAVVRRGRVARLDRLARGLVHAEPGGTHGPADKPHEVSPAGGSALDSLEDAMEELDVRVRRQLKDLAKNSRNLMALIDGLDMPVLATGEGGAVLLCNRAAESLVGAAPGTLAGRGVAELFTRPEILDMHARARAGETTRGQVKLVTPLGTRTYQVSATPLPAAWGEGVFGAILVLRDVTELAQAVTVKSDFVANASHELRTPVAALRAALETLEDGADEEPAVRRSMLAVCSKHALRLEEMVRDLMDLSRLESPDLPVRPGLVDVAELEDAMRLTFEPACKPRSLRLRFDIEPGLQTLRGDARLLGLILRNLIDNAVKYAYENTEVRVRLAREPAPAGDTLLIEVSDRGVGIPLAQQDRVFERFYQIDPARTGFTAKRGTGLGLAIVKHAAKALGGGVGLSSVWGEGTTVWARVPITAEGDPGSGEQDAKGARTDDDGSAP